MEQLRRFATSGYLFALMDSTDQILIPHQAKLLGPGKAISLFSGTAKEQYWQVAPYLFQVDPAVLDWMVAKIWKEPWGVFAITKASFEDLRVHFKKFLLAQLPDGKVWYFRYYDPRILKSYLPVCDPWELQKFFGPVRAFAIAGGEQEKPTMVQGMNIPPAPRTSPPEATIWWKIRTEQQKEFDRVAEHGFVSRCVQFLKEKLPALVKPIQSQDLRDRVQAAIARARGYGIKWQSTLLAFVALEFEIGLGFDQHPLVRKFLTSTALDPNEKPQWIMKSLNDADWVDIRRFVASQAKASGSFHV